MTKRGGNPESHSFNPEKRSIEHPLAGIVAENKAPMWATILAPHLQLGLASKCYLGSLYILGSWVKRSANAFHSLAFSKTK